MEQELLPILRALESPHHLRQAHARLLAAGFSASPRLLPALVAAAFSAHSTSYAAAALRAAGRAASTVSHNTLIERLAGSRHRPSDALFAYAAMRAAGVPPNGFTFTFLLRACALLRLPRSCGCVHGQIVRCGFGGDVVVQNALLDVYYKCSGTGIVGPLGSGDAIGALELFQAMPERNVVSWNTVVAGFVRVGNMALAREVFDRMPTRNAISCNLIISGYNHNSRYDEALHTFQQMMLEGQFRPDEATLKLFCSTMICAEEELNWMTRSSLLHYCLAHGGNLQEAILFIERMPVKPSVVIWVTVLSSCVAHGDADLTDAMEGRWDGVVAARTIMRNWGTEKMPGSSSIQVGSEVHEFLAKDTRHQRRKEIYQTVDGLMALMRHTELEAHWPLHHKLS
ncbi:hypothetical protein GUJ93_ZPchr0007g3078 [Zizania palustris]|uniref:Pentatricopeptide repeat-containing protein n=1 Tax=Zizania palustris TaxID=103762 RepID=A0A8J5T6S8_ZIZPA|nr:hypothetical protein GUJ93_ZPchr0007g3078 [Zizania palustris]